MSFTTSLDKNLNTYRGCKCWPRERTLVQCMRTLTQAVSSKHRPGSESSRCYALDVKLRGPSCKHPILGRFVSWQSMMEEIVRIGEYLIAVITWFSWLLTFADSIFWAFKKEPVNVICIPVDKYYVIFNFIKNKKYKKKLLWIVCYKPKQFKKHPIYKQSELKYLSNFRKRNQTRFYIKCEVR